MDRDRPGARAESSFFWLTLLLAVGVIPAKEAVTILRRSRRGPGPLTCRSVATQDEGVFASLYDEAATARRLIGGFIRYLRARRPEPRTQHPEL